MTDVEAVLSDSGSRSWWANARASILSRNARGWYFGSIFGLVYQVLIYIAVWESPGSVGSKVTVSAILLVFYALFPILPPMLWWAPLRQRVIGIIAYWVFAAAVLPLLGWDGLWLFTLVAAVVGTLCEEVKVAAAFTAALAVVPLVHGFATDFSDSASLSWIFIVAIASMMFTLTRQIRTVRELREVQAEVARLAVVEERNRFARDMHDVLGHSLTVVSVKSELARRLLAADPDRAQEELADIQRLTRSALTDLRAAVAGYREADLATELDAARAALAAADIAAVLPPDGDAAAPELRALFAWVLREGVTNVIRHSDARTCWVRLTRSELTVEDDGTGIAPEAQGTDGGSGLRGLRERAEAAGAALEIAPSPHGGVRLAVRRRAS
ncbi:sensor histidine kinase [Leifsonia sp. AG29]|uniref:sensor histidine kinase n=1 Tax=Leifsonia sp. AG29 TaxID=2598860 RepID=UPI00131D7252|nr:sensor histidine kinase [Leifsonia sp. AG29]